MRRSKARYSQGNQPRQQLTAREVGVQGLHLVVLWGFAVSQPIFDLLATEPSFFIVRGSRSSDVLLLALFLAVVAPLPLVLLNSTSALAGRLVNRLIHGFLVAGLITAIFLPPLHRWLQESTLAPILLAAAFGCAGTWLYLRFATVRQYFTWLLAVVVLFPVVFLLSPGIRKVAFPRPVSSDLATAPGSTVPLVLVVLDELPLVSLLDEKGLIDPIRYPNLAALAGEATWYANATSVADFTAMAVPAIVTGKYPSRGLLPVVHDYPQNLFTLLAGSHELQVLETFTRLCPPSLCPEQRSDFPTRFGSLLSDLTVIYLHTVLPDPMTKRLPSVEQNWQGMNLSDPDSSQLRARAEKRWRGDRAGRFQRFVEDLRAHKRPSFVFLHTSLPHAPWAYLPSGLRYPNDGEPAWKSRGLWATEEKVVNEVYLRHLLQVGYVDTLVGELVQRLREVGLYDPSVIVVTSDHGISFRPGGKRRKIDYRNRHDILSVPLIVKAPFQTKGIVDVRTFEGVDLLPTIAVEMGLEVPWKMTGKPVHDPATPSIRAVVAFATSPGAWKKIITKPEQLKNRSKSLRRKLELFGSGSVPLRPPPPEEFKGLIGLATDGVDIAGTSDIRLELPLPTTALDLDPNFRFAPIRLSGTVSSSDGRQGPFYLAVAVNGLIQAVTEVGAKGKPHDGAFWFFLLEEASFNQGSNEAEFFVAERQGDRFRLRRAVAVFSDS